MGKKFWLWFILCLIVVSILSFFIAYKMTINRINQREELNDFYEEDDYDIIDYSNQENINNDENVEDTSDISDDDFVSDSDMEEVESSMKDVVTEVTKIELYKKYANGEIIESDEIEKESILRYSRNMLEDYAMEYMQNPSEIDIEEGITSFYVQSFSPEKVVFIKTYNNEYQEYYQLYLDEENKVLVAVTPDGKELTFSVKIESLSLEDIENLKAPGIKVYNEEELFAIIESYSS